MGNEGSRKIIGIQRFKDLIESLEDMAEGQSSEADLKMNFEDESKPSRSKKISQAFTKIVTGTGFFAYVFQFFSYLAVRIRVVLVLTSVAAEVFGGVFDAVKRFVVRRLFWGRGNLFKYAVMVVGVFFFVVILVSRNYRSEVLLAAEIVETKASPSVMSVDVFVQNSTTKTQTPEEGITRIEPEDYIVKSGDTLSTIAEEKGITVETIQWANNLTAANVLRAGAVLRIPQGNGVLYKVGSGETLDAIVKKFTDRKQNTNSQVIADANGLLPPFDLVEGQELIIPDVRPPDPPKPVYASSFSGGIVTAGSPNWSAGYVDPNVGSFLTTYPVAAGALVTQCPSTWHMALDLSSGGMPDLVAAADGVVNFAGCHSGDCPASGNMIGGSGAGWGVEIDHGNGYTTLYAHMNAIYVTKGQVVHAGDHIGQMGRSGTATGVHLHFELWQGKKWSRVNPVYYFADNVHSVISNFCGY